MQATQTKDRISTIIIHTQDFTTPDHTQKTLTLKGSVARVFNMLLNRGAMEVGLLWSVFQDVDILDKLEDAGIRLEYDGPGNASFVELSPQVEFTILDID